MSQPHPYALKKTNSAIIITHNDTEYHRVTDDLPSSAVRRIMEHDCTFRVIECPETNEPRILIQFDCDNGRLESYIANRYKRDLDADVYAEEFTSDELREIIMRLRARLDFQSHEIKALKDTIAENDHNDLLSSLAPDLLDRVQERHWFDGCDRHWHDVNDYWYDINDNGY